MKIVVIANCQAAPVSSLLGIGSSEVEINRVPAVHTIKGDRANVILDAVAASDVVIHQPIGANFGPIATNELKDAFPNKRFVSFPSIYFGGLLPHLVYLRLPGGGTLQGPLGDYHDRHILRSFLTGISEAECLAGFSSSPVDAKEHFQECLEESIRRDAEVDLPVMDAVQDRIPFHQTFYTFNHCDNFILWTVAQRALKLLGVAADGPPSPPITKMLGGVIARVPSEILDQLGFDWRQEEYIVSGSPVANDRLISDFYSCYTGCGNLDHIIRHNKGRFSLSI